MPRRRAASFETHHEIAPGFHQVLVDDMISCGESERLRVTVGTQVHTDKGRGHFVHTERWEVELVFQPEDAEAMRELLDDWLKDRKKAAEKGRKK